MSERLAVLDTWGGMNAPEMEVAYVGTKGWIRIRDANACVRGVFRDIGLFYLPRSVSNKDASILA